MSLLLDPFLLSYEFRASFLFDYLEEGAEEDSSDNRARDLLNFD